MSDTRYAVETAMALIVLGLVYAVVWIAATVAMKLLWGWIVPDIFVGMVEQGLLPASITLLQAFKLGIFSLLFWSGSGNSDKMLSSNGRR